MLRLATFSILLYTLLVAKDLISYKTKLFLFITKSLQKWESLNPILVATSSTAFEAK